MKSSSSSSSSAYNGQGCFRSCFRFAGCWNRRRRKRRLKSFLLHDNDLTQDIFYDCEEHIHDGDDDSKYYSESDDELQEDLHYMVSCLSDDELEVAARTSYHYLIKSRHHQDRETCAIQMARRYLLSKKQVPKALQCMKETLHFRTSIGIDSLRQAFDDNDSDFSEHDKKKLFYMLASKKNYVMGYDKEGRSTYIFVPRCARDHDMEWTLKESLYTMERALACSKHLDGTINAVIDCTGFNYGKHAPSFAIGTAFLRTLRKHYVGCFHKIFILDAPLGFAILWNILLPFVGTSTRHKILFLSGSERRNQVLRECYSPTEAPRWMVHGGKKNRDLDVDEYLYTTPFDHAFDE